MTNTLIVAHLPALTGRWVVTVHSHGCQEIGTAYSDHDLVEFVAAALANGAPHKHRNQVRSRVQGRVPPLNVSKCNLA
ncbi:hypothetical protein ACIP5U_33870 [Streptomyces sp. NPDC088788]|uniref:hypothetical protein n=1 Tax=Streptomyces sp. NPDC088788 TaxID=3365898 RepID=UPI0037F757B8